jgi:hypothetical protein
VREGYGVVKSAQNEIPVELFEKPDPVEIRASIGVNVLI